MAMQIQNIRLFRALSEISGGRVEVGSQGSVAVFSVPAASTTGFDVVKEAHPLDRKRKLVWAMLAKSHWGETYAIPDPVCADDKCRLHFSACSLFNVRKPGTSTELIAFGANCHCFHNGCEIHSKELFRRKVLDPLRAALGGIPEVATFEELWGEIPGRGRKLRASSFGDRTSSVSTMDDADRMVKPVLALTSPQVPPEVIAYLEGRGFSAEELFNQYGILYAPPNAVYADFDAKEPRRTWDHRIVAPINQSNSYQSWQARAAGKSKCKYLFPPGSNKSAWLYNKDVAKLYGRILVTEGITNVWAFGSSEEHDRSSLATFGKDISDEQIASMRMLFGWGAKGVLCLDPDAAHKLPGTVDRMLEAQCFGDGLAALVLDDGMDPAEMLKLGRMEEMYRLFDEKISVACHDRGTILAGLDGRIAEAAAREHERQRKDRQRKDPFDVF